MTTETAELTASPQMLEGLAILSRDNGLVNLQCRINETIHRSEFLRSELQAIRAAKALRAGQLPDTIREAVNLLAKQDGTKLNAMIRQSANVSASSSTF